MNIAVIHYSKRAAKLSFRLNDSFAPNPSFGNITEMSHCDVWNSVMNALRKAGLSMNQDKEISKQYKCLSPFHKYGEYNGLECKANIYPTGFDFNFFQNINTGDRKPGDGQYAFNQYSLMPYLIKIRLQYAMNIIIAAINKHIECEVECSDVNHIAELAVIENKSKSCHNKTEVKTLDDIKNQLSPYDHSNNSSDRDKKKIVCGDIKYTRDNGRLVRGKVYHNLNAQWYFIVNKYELHQVQSYTLFDPTEDDFKQRRVKVGKIPEEKAKRLQIIKQATTKELSRELKIRLNY